MNVPKAFLKCVLMMFVAILSLQSFAKEIEELPDAKPNSAKISIVEPARNVGYTVGDILTREITLTVYKPYKLIDESLPIVGYEKRYKGQLIGIDLSAISHTKEEVKNGTRHKISLSYQVFTNNVVAKHAALPQEYLRLVDTQKKGEVVKFRVPSWDFTISPIAMFGQVKVEQDMTGFRGPLLLNAAPQKLHLKVLLALLGLSLIGLLYMLGKHAWLPRMGGPFARSYRQIRKLPNTSESLEKAVTSLHQSLNTTAGSSIFSNNLDDFLRQKPAFEPIKDEIKEFFTLSRHVFFEPSVQHSAGSNPIQWLTQFSRHCRDCERGLIPDLKA